MVMDEKFKKVFLSPFAPHNRAKVEMSVAGGHHRDLLRGSVKLLSWVIEKGLLPATVIIASLVAKKPVK